MADLKPCPRPSWQDLPNLSRDIPAFLFVPMCLPGTETASGCPADKAFYTIAVTWPQFLTGWTAPGGNRYWASPRFAANVRDPKVAGILRLMAARSRNYFQDRAGSKELRDLKMSQVIGKPVPSKPTQKVTAKPGGGMTITFIPGVPDVFEARYGHMQVAIAPDPNETMTAFAKRGGYLLHTGGEGTLRTGFMLQAQGPRPWMGSKVREVQLWGDYNAVDQTIGYTIRLEYESDWAQTVNSVDAWLRKNLAKLCTQLSSPEAIAAAAALSAFPATAPYLAAYGAALSMCSLSQIPAAACVPQPPQPGAYLPPANSSGVILTVGGKPNTAMSAGTWLPGSASTVQNVRPVPGGPAPEVNSPYPPGTIAWYDPSVRAYRIAVPYAGAGVTHMSRGELLQTLPAVGILLVDKGGWERATLPWLRRSSSKIGMMIGGIFVASAATVYVSRH